MLKSTVKLSSYWAVGAPPARVGSGPCERAW
jgi:hypothetical protein